MIKEKIISILMYCMIVIFCQPLAGFSAGISLMVTERYGVDRIAAPVTYGIPFSREDNLLTADDLFIPGKQTQFRVLSRYEGTPDDATKPIRMVLLDFQTDINALENREFVLQRHADKALGSPRIVQVSTKDNRFEITQSQFQKTKIDKVHQPDLARKIKNGVEVNTGPGLFRISSTRGNIFDHVSVNGKTILQDPVSDGFHIVFEDKTYSSSNIAPFNVTIEENGPLRSVVKVEGEFADNNGTLLIPPPTRVGTVPETPLRYTIRYFAYKNKSYLKLQVTLRNENKGWTYQESRPVHNIHISEAFIKTTLNGLSEEKTVNFDEIYKDTFVENEYAILQRELSDGSKPEYDWQYNITQNSIPVANGQKYDTFVNLRDNTKGLMVASRWFWQNHPIGVSIKNNEFFMNLWPDARDYRWPPNDGKTHRILGGIWKTHEILYSFHGSKTMFDQEVAHIKQRLIAKCSDVYYAQTDFFPFMAPAEVKSDFTFPAGEKLQEALIRHNNRHKALFDKRFIENRSAPNTIFDIRDGRKVKLTRNPDNFATWYGWLEFGGMPRAPHFGYHNQHYDWSYLALLGFLRFSNYNMFEIAEEFLRHKADILVIHDPDAMPGDGSLRYEYHGGQRYEQDALFSYHDDYGPYNSAPRKASHFWTSGLTLQYLLNGEKFYHDVAVQCYEHIIRVKDYPTMKDAETRNAFRGIDALINAYNLKGEKRYLDAAYEIFTNNLLIHEGGPNARDGKSGWIQGGAPGTVGVGGDSWQIEPIIKLHKTLLAAEKPKQADQLKAFLFRWSEWARNTLWTILPHGEYRSNKTEYFPYIINSVWKIESNTFSGIVDAEHSLGYSNLFAYRYQIDTAANSIEWLTLSRYIFKDYHYYGNLSKWTETRLNVLKYPHGSYGFNDVPSSGHWKVPKAILSPMYYISNESKFDE